MATTQTWTLHWIVPDKVADDDVVAWAEREWGDEVGERAVGAPQVEMLLAGLQPPPLGLRLPPRIVRVTGRVR